MTTQSDKLLFTPGPLTTSPSVKAVMTRDLGSRDYEFISVVKNIRHALLGLGGQVDDSQYTAILMQGSGTFGVESVISSTVAPEGKLLVIVNGAYGRRIVQMANILHIETIVLTYPEDTQPNLTDIEMALQADDQISMVVVIHCETTTGLLNPIVEIGQLVARYQRQYFVDAMSSFGAIPVDLAEAGITYLVSSSNKCIEGVPGFSFALAQREALQKTAGYARSLSLDLFSQWQGLEKDGQFRFTPPIQVMLAFEQALKELDEEGGVAGRAKRYQQNHATLLAGMRQMGFSEYLAPHLQSYIITSFHYPTHPNFQFETFYRLLNERGLVIYPGKLSQVDCFRIGNIGRLYPADISRLLEAIQDTIDAMGLNPLDGN